MAYRVTKTEHTGAKKGAGFWGPKAEAKHQSNRIRRRDDTVVVNLEMDTSSLDPDGHRNVTK